MKNRRQIILGCMAALICLAPLIANAQPESSAKHKRPHARLWEELGLTNEQRAKIAELHIETKVAREEHVKKIKELRKQTREELLQENPSKTTLSELAIKSGELERVYTEKRNEHLLKIKGILTPEQFTKLIDRDRHTRLGENDTAKRMKHHRSGADRKDQDQ